MISSSRWDERGCTLFVSWTRLRRKLTPAGISELEATSDAFRPSPVYRACSAIARRSDTALLIFLHGQVTEPQAQIIQLLAVVETMIWSGQACNPAWAHWRPRHSRGVDAVKQERVALRRRCLRANEEGCTQRRPWGECDEDPGALGRGIAFSRGKSGTRDTRDEMSKCREIGLGGHAWRAGQENDLHVADVNNA